VQGNDSVSGCLQGEKRVWLAGWSQAACLSMPVSGEATIGMNTLAVVTQAAKALSSWQLCEMGFACMGCAAALAIRWEESSGGRVPAAQEISLECGGSFAAGAVASAGFNVK
jgi:hypothetical protein